MTAAERKILIETKLKLALHPSRLTIIDESYAHVGHAGSKTGASHFAVEIHSEALNSLSKVKQHQKIYEIIGDLIPQEIHALRIIIL